MEGEIVLSTTRSGITTLVLNKPEKHNAFDEHLITRLTQLLLRHHEDPHTRVVILTANGANFSAGADLTWMQKMISYSKEENMADAQQLATLFKTLKHLSKPTIALVQGKTFGGGLGLLACCDIVIAAADASFCFSEAKLGLVPATIAPYIIQAMGARAAQYFFLTAQPFTADMAKYHGLIHEIVESTHLLSAGHDLARRLQANGPQALTVIKQLIARCLNQDDELLTETAELIASIRISAEAQEGLSAFLEKRQPQWQSLGNKK